MSKINLSEALFEDNQIMDFSGLEVWNELKVFLNKFNNY